MQPSLHQIQALLAARRNDRPDEGYWQDFIVEFHRRQRGQSMVAGGLTEGWRRLAGYASELGSAKWAYGFGLVYAGVTVAFFLVPAKVDIEKAPPMPVNHQVIPAPAPVPEKAELKPDRTDRAAQMPVGALVF